jgi:membrane fusion protein (multidrug efflux system)
MRRQAWVALGGVVVLAVAGGAWVAMQPGAMPGGQAQAAKQPGAAASAPLEFRANEVVQPQRASLLGPAGGAATPPWCGPRPRGTLLALTVAEGSRVKAGQALGRIDLAELAAAHGRAQAPCRLGARHAGPGRAHPCQQ